MTRMNDPSESREQIQGQGSAAGQAREQASKMGESLREMGSQARDTAQAQLDQIRQSAAEYYQQGRERAAEYYQQGREKAMEWEHTMEDYIREQPMKSVLIAAGAGLLLGFLWRRS